MRNVWFGNYSGNYDQISNISSIFGLKFSDDFDYTKEYFGNGKVVMTYNGIKFNKEILFGILRFSVIVKTKILKNNRIEINLEGVINNFYNSNQNFQANCILDLKSKTIEGKYNYRNYSKISDDNSSNLDNVYIPNNFSDKGTFIIYSNLIKDISFEGLACEKIQHKGSCIIS